MEGPNKLFLFLQTLKDGVIERLARKNFAVHQPSFILEPGVVPVELDYWAHPTASVTGSRLHPEARASVMSSCAYAPMHATP